jgi:hypothetical protein
MESGITLVFSDFTSDHLHSARGIAEVIGKKEKSE